MRKSIWPSLKSEILSAREGMFDWWHALFVVNKSEQECISVY
jgi:hypothetical protein